MNNIVWRPTHPEQSNLAHFMHFVDQQHSINFADYQALHDWSVKYPELFWPSLCDFFQITFDTPATEIINQYQHMLDAKWFSGATFNFAEKLLSQETKSLSKPAIISTNETGEREVLTYHQLKMAVSECAAGLKAVGVTVGDRVAGVMPNVAYTIIAMLATASIGAIWASCSPDFGSGAITDRLGQIEPKVVFICDGHQYNGKIHEAFHKIQDLSASIPSITHLVIYPHINSQAPIYDIPKTCALNTFIQPASTLTFTSVPFEHPLYILFSSGTTGKPKCIIHGAGGTLLQHIKELGLHTDIKPNDNLLFYTTCGWMMWNWMVSTLALGATLTLYEGSPSYPTCQHLFQIIDQDRVTIFGTSAKFIATLEKEGLCPKTLYTMPALRTILSTGSPLLPHSYDYVEKAIKPTIQISSISGGTDIVSCFALGNPLLPVYSGELQCLGLGMNVKIYDESGHAVENQRGELVCTQAFPCMPVGFWNDPDKSRYRSAYFEKFSNVWAHGDFAEITSHHGLIIYGRSDATLNPGGVRIGTAEIYRQLEKIPEILDSVVIGQNYQDDVRIVLFLKLMNQLTLTESLQNTIRQTIRAGTSPRHVPSLILQVNDIPRTINGKLVEIAVRQTVEGEPVKNLDSLANPEALDYFKNIPELGMCMK